MTSGHDAVDDLPDDLLPENGGAGVFLHSFGVMARFRCAAADGEDADRQVRERLQGVRELYDDTRVEPQEPDGRWAVDVRFVVASLDGETAVEGVHTTLREKGLAPDEAWLAEQLP